MHIDPAVLALALTMVGMILFAVLLIIGSVRGILAEQEEARQNQRCCCPCHGK